MSYARLKHLTTFPFEKPDDWPKDVDWERVDRALVELAMALSPTPKEDDGRSDPD